MDPIKEAFQRIKEDIHLLREEITILKEGINRLKIQTNSLSQPVKTSQQTDQQTQNPTNESENMALKGLYSSNSNSSIGNRGVPTDKQTDKQTDQQTNKLREKPLKDTISEFKRANEILSQLDSVKHEIRNTFKSLTAQEMKVFSTLYQLENEGDKEITYRKIACLLSLSESSIRDYVNKILQKGVLIEKIRQNNKTIYLKIASSITNIASLATIEQLRQL